MSFWRLARIVVSGVILITASYYAVVAFDNISNPASNWVFVRGVMSLDGVPADSGFGWRAIDATPIQVAGYVGIILGETVSAVLLAVGGIGGLRRTSSHDRWLRTQRWSLLGCAAGLLVFFFGFIVVGGNWWVMYLNDKWNGLGPAFQDSVLTALAMLGVLVVAIGGRSESVPPHD